MNDYNDTFVSLKMSCQAFVDKYSFVSTCESQSLMTGERKTIVMSDIKNKCSGGSAKLEGGNSSAPSGAESSGAAGDGSSSKADASEAQRVVVAGDDIKIDADFKKHLDKNTLQMRMKIQDLKKVNSLILMKDTDASSIKLALNGQVLSGWQFKGRTALEDGPQYCSLMTVSFSKIKTDEDWIYLDSRDLDANSGNPLVSTQNLVFVQESKINDFDDNDLMIVTCYNKNSISRTIQLKHVRDHFTGILNFELEDSSKAKKPEAEAEDPAAKKPEGVDAIFGSGGRLKEKPAK